MINHNQAPQFGTEPVSVVGDIPALSAQPFDADSQPATPWAVEARQQYSPLVQESLRKGMPHAKEAIMRTPGRTGQAIDIQIHFNPAPEDAIGTFRRIEQYQIMIKGKDGLRPFSPPFFWDHNGAYTSNAAGEMGGSFKKVLHSPDSTVQPGEKPLLEMRERIQRLSDKKIVAEVIKWHKITHDNSQ